MRGDDQRDGNDRGLRGVWIPGCGGGGEREIFGEDSSGRSRSG